VINPLVFIIGRVSRVSAIIEDEPNSTKRGFENMPTAVVPARETRGVPRFQDGNGDGGVACDTGSFKRR
jgi:hypothetical protein